MIFCSFENDFFVMDSFCQVVTYMSPFFRCFLLKKSC